MLGIIVQLALSWLIIWWFEKGNLSFLGFKPNGQRLKDFLLFFIVAACCASSGYFLTMLIAKQHWHFNTATSWSAIGSGVWYMIKSVLFEELIFRGVLFYILIKKLGAAKAIIISSCAFGVYHWFTQTGFSDPVQMLIIFIITGLAGVVYAYGYAKTFSLYVPAAIHLGWNLVGMVLFSNNTGGQQLFVKNTTDQQVTISYFSFYTMQLLPLLLFYAVNGWLLWRKRKVFAEGIDQTNKKAV